MRPAQKAPENGTSARESGRRTIHFNEAGAKSAGKRPSRRNNLRLPVVTSMRPAQKAPENDAVVEWQRRQKATSMRSAQKAPENGMWITPMKIPSATSMRPAQKAPENNAKFDPALKKRMHFNEAGAKSAGKQPLKLRKLPGPTVLQ